MSSPSSESIILSPPDIEDEARAVIENLVPTKSKERYLKAYEEFIQWRDKRKSKSISENILIAYFNFLSMTMKPTSLWVKYSMLKSTIFTKHNVNLKDYHNLTNFLRRTSDGYKCKKSPILTTQNIEKFLNEAPDSEYLAMKVVLIFGIYGACRCIELTNITINDIETHKKLIIVTLRDTKTKIDRTFVIRDTSFAIIQKYQALRPTDVKTNRFFLNYRQGKCTKQVIGRHTIAAIPKVIATYLNLPNPEHFTGHCFRNTSATLLSDTGSNLITLNRHVGWKTECDSESFTEESIEMKTEITNQINESILKPMSHAANLSHHDASASAFIKQEPPTGSPTSGQDLVELSQTNTCMNLNRHGEWKSECDSESYTEESFEMKTEITNQINESIHLKPMSHAANLSHHDASASAFIKQEPTGSPTSGQDLMLQQSITAAVELSQTNTCMNPGKSVLNFNKYSVAYVTVPNTDVGKTIGHGLVKNKLAACVNIVPQITSVYEWKGEIQEDSEALLMIKTRTSHVDKLTEFVRSNHPYEVCEVISLPIHNGNPAYLKWIGESVPEVVCPGTGCKSSN